MKTLSEWAEPILQRIKTQDRVPLPLLPKFDVTRFELQEDGRMVRKGYTKSASTGKAKA
jgi:hypothetical protein